MSWVCLVTFSWLNMPETPPPGGIQEVSWPDAWTISTGSSWCEGTATLLWVSPEWLNFSPYLQGRVQPPCGGNSFKLFVPAISSFGHYPQFMTLGKGRNKDKPLNREPCLLSQLSIHHNKLVQTLHHWRCCTDPAVNLLLLTRKRDLNILKTPPLE